MGGSSSKSNIYQEANMVNINRSDITAVNKKVNDLSTEVVMNQAKSCGQGLVQDATIKVKGVRTKGKFVFRNKVDQDSLMSFKCINATEISNEIGNKMQQELMNAVDTNVDQEALAKMASAAKAKAASGSLSVPWGSSESQNNLTQIVNNTNITDTKKVIKNIVENKISNSFKSDDVQKCFAQVNQNSDVAIMDIDAEEGVEIMNDVSQTTEMVTDCLQKTITDNKVIDDIADVMGVRIVEKTKQTGKSEQEAKSETESQKKGMIEETGGAIAEAAKGIGEGIGSILPDFNFGFGGMGSGASISIVLCCCLIIMAVVGFLFFGGDMMGTGAEQAGGAFLNQYSATSPF